MHLIVVKLAEMAHLTNTRRSSGLDIALGFLPDVYDTRNLIARNENISQQMTRDHF